MLSEAAVSGRVSSGLVCSGMRQFVDGGEATPEHADPSSITVGLHVQLGPCGHSARAIRQPRTRRNTFEYSLLILNSSY